MRYPVELLRVFSAIIIAGCLLVLPVSAADLEDQSAVVVKVTQQDGALTSKSRGEWNGFKGYRHHRSGYRKHSDGWWYPEAAFQPGAQAAPAVIKPKKANQKTRSADDKPWQLKNHLDYCAAKYKSYTSADNSYQPFEGPRKQCVSRYYKG